MTVWGWNQRVRAVMILGLMVLAASLAWKSRSELFKAGSLPSLVVDPNSVPVEVLQALPGLGPVLAGRIVTAREVSPFRSLADFDRRVKGVGPVTMAGLTPYLRVDSRNRP